MKNLNRLGKSIGIIGRKRIGKNFFAKVLSDILIEKGITGLKEISIGKYLKENSYKMPSEGNNEFNYNYLLEDFKLSIETGFYKLGKFNNNIISKIDLNKDDYGFSDLNDEEKMYLIEIFKTIDKFKTRTSLQIFGDYLKRKHNNPFFLSSSLLSSVKTSKYEIISGYINTDIRFITELLDFIIEGFYIISLKNDDLDVEYPWTEHISEIELGLSKEKIGKIIDLKSNSGEIIVDGIKRLSRKEFYEKVELIIPHLLSFQGYFKKDISYIKKLKTELINGKYNFFDLQQKLSDNFILYIKNKNNKEAEKMLIDSYNKYVDKRDIIISEINNVLKKYY